jgi:hypothetical protein
MSTEYEAAVKKMTMTAHEAITDSNAVLAEVRNALRNGGATVIYEGGKRAGLSYPVGNERRTIRSEEIIEAGKGLQTGVNALRVITQL